MSTVTIIVNPPAIGLTFIDEHPMNVSDPWPIVPPYAAPPATTGEWVAKTYPYELSGVTATTPPLQQGGFETRLLVIFEFAT